MCDTKGKFIPEKELSRKGVKNLKLSVFRQPDNFFLLKSH